MNGMELRIYNQDDRLLVAQILVKNGYWVGQSKKQKPGSKSVEYFLKIMEDETNVCTAIKKGDA